MGCWEKLSTFPTCQNFDTVQIDCAMKYRLQSEIFKLEVSTRFPNPRIEKVGLYETIEREKESGARKSGYQRWKRFSLQPVQIQAVDGRGAWGQQRLCALA